MFDGNSRGEAGNIVHVRFVLYAEKLPCIGGKRFHIAPLAFGIKRVESQGRLSGTGRSRYHDELVSRNINVDVF